MPKYVNPPRFDPEDLEGIVDPYGGFLCLSMHWRPDPEAADPEMPGQKLSMSSYIPMLPEEECLCGSGKHYRDCCQPERLWYPVCPNPGGTDRGFSLNKPQAARFRDVDGSAIRERLMADRRLRCTEDELARGFWTLFGDPLVEQEYGILCFGDIELKHNRTLVVGAMSDLRMQTLLALLREIADDLLGEPRITYREQPVVDKRTGESRMQRASPPRSQSPKRRKRRKRRR